MIKKNQHMLNIFNMLSDILIIFISYFIAVVMRFFIFKGEINVDFFSGQFVLAAMVYSVALVFAYWCCRMYGSYRFKRVGEENINILAINAIGCSLLLAVMYLLKIMDFSRWVIALFWFVSSAIVILKRFIVRSILRHMRKLGYNQKHVLVIGDGNLAKQYIKDVENNRYIGVTVDGYVGSIKKDGLNKNLGSYEELEKILDEIDIDEIIVALEMHEAKFMKYVMELADKEGIGIKMIPFFNKYFPKNATMETVGKTKLINVRVTPLDNLGWAFVKRMMDICGSLFGLIVLSPIYLITAIGVKLSSPGPIFFKQDRIGLNKKPFKMYKFRSMRVNTEETTGWSTNTDPRKTSFGSFIRKYSIDELPQLFNVLKGDMSLIGPRPEIPFYVRQFKEEVPLYLLRHQVRPGMTGWAQVHGLRGDTSIEARVEYDIWYIENWSLWLDIKILWKTVFGGLKNNEEIITKDKEKV